MLLSFNFLKQYVKLPDVKPADVALALTMSTVEVDGVIDQAAELSGIVVGRILEIVKHPQADRLWVCRVDVKTEELQIICGGSNLTKGMNGLQLIIFILQNNIQTAFIGMLLGLFFGL